MASRWRALATIATALLVVPVIVATGASAAIAAAPDVSEPQLVEFDVTPLSVDVSSAGQTISVRARITDDQAGTVTPTMLLSSQSTDQSAGFGSMRLASGDALDGWYEWSATIPTGAAPGAWDVVLYPLRDARGNAGDFGPASHFPSVVNVVNPGGSDVQPPELIEFEASPLSVDVSTAAQVVSVRARITDDQSGTVAPTMLLSSANTDQTAGFASMRRTAGNALDGWYEWSATIPQGAAPGGWDVVLYPLRDTRGNAGSFGPPSTFTSTLMVTNSGGSDVSPPQLTALEINPRTIDVADSGRVVSVRARITDNQSGTVTPTMLLSSETTDQTAGFGSMRLVSGNALDGWYEWSATVPRGAAPGPWEVVLYPLRDNRGNSGGFGPPSWFEHTVNVVNFSGDTTAPHVVDFSVTPGTYYADEASASISVRARITDNASGATAPSVRFANSSRSTIIEQRLALVSGTANDGIYEWSGPLSQARQAGSWTAELSALSDVRGNVTAPTPATVKTFTVALGARPSVASAPRAVTATAGNGSASIAWQAPASSGSPAITSYVVTAAPGGRTATVPATALTATVAGLTNGTAYSFTVVAVNAAGTSPASEASAPVTPRTVPATPTAPTATAGDRSASVAWSAPSNNGGAAVSSYVVTASPGGRSVTSAGSATSATVTGLTNGTAYTFTVVAANAAGSSARSAASAAVTPRTVANAPAGVSATAGVGSAVVTWPVPTSNGGAAVTSYVVTAAPGGKTATVPAPATSATITGLTNGTAYTFTVVAVNTAGNSPASSPSAPVTPFDALERIAGSDRFATAAAISERFPVGVDTVYIASGMGFPDALAGAALASKQDAPILLALRDGVPQSTLDALRRLQPKNIVILGGLPTLSDAVRQQLLPYGSVSRIAGADRFATAAMISERFAPGVDTVYVASGMNFPDALAGAALAGAQGAPVLLTAPGDVRDSMARALERLDPQRIVVLGGTPSVSRDVEVALRQYGTVTRIAGADRFETASLVAARFPDADRVFIANGANFPDALAGAALAGGQGAPVMLALRDYLAPSTVTQIERLAPQQVVVLGDANAIGDGIAAQLRAVVE